MVNLWKLVHKINLRWYITPAIIYKFDPAVQPLCWRNDGEIGSLYHLLWQCNKVSSLWSKVFQLLSEDTGISLAPSPELALLGIVMENIPHCLHTIAIHILPATRLAIVHHWKTPDLLSKNKVVTLVHTHGSYECMFATCEIHLQKWSQKWSYRLMWFRNAHHKTS